MTEKENQEFVWYDAKEMPKFFPERLIPAEIGDTKGVLLDKCHSEHYIPTEEAKQELSKKLKKFGQWAYIIGKQRGM